MSGGQALCADCAECAHLFAKGFVCMDYGSGRRILHGFKYGGRAYYGESVAQIMYDRICGEMPEADMLLPVPMYGKKERKRGYNQADVAGRLLARKLGLPYEDALLRRVRGTAAMSRLKAEERAANVRGAFAVAPGGESRLAGRRVMLVDDIFTTGSTVDACAETLLAGGAKAVYFIVLAAGAGV
jgi:ComF family protein